MARIDNLNNFLTDVADAIRTKTGSSDTISAEDFDTEIENIPSGGGDDWSDIGYSSMPKTYKSSYDYAKEVYDNWPSSYTNVGMILVPHRPNLVIMPLVDTSLDTENGSWFYNCVKLEEIPAIVFNSKTTNSMFNKCGKLKYADLTNFDTSRTTDMASMFKKCTSLTTIIFGNNFTFSAISGNALDSMFADCTKLDNDTLNAILYLCTTATSYTGTKTLATLGINNTFDNFANIPNLSNYQAFLNAGWTIS